MKLLICEKKTQATEFAGVMGWKPGRGCFEGTLEGEPIRLVWARGHLLTLKSPDEVKEGLSWDNPETLLPLPQEYQLRVIPNIPNLPAHAQAKGYLDNIKHFLSQKPSEVVIATDSDREGEAIGWNIINFLGYKGPVRRAWFSAGLDSKSIKEAMEGLRPPETTKGWFRASEARARSDWAYMLLVRAYTYYASYSKFGNHLGRGDKRERVMSVGRVQTPALAMIVNRDLEIENFVPKDHFTISADFSASGSGQLPGTYSPKVTREIIDAEPVGVTWEASKTPPKNENDNPLEKPLYTGKAEVEAFRERLISNADKAYVKKYEERERISHPPKTFDLAEAQSALASACNISSGLAQTVFEDLYEQGWTSYARTSKSELPNNFYEPEYRNGLFGSLMQLSEVSEKAALAQAIHNGENPDIKPFKPEVFTNKQMEHWGIIPTPQVMTQSAFASLTPKKKEKGKSHTTAHMQTAYLLVAKQFIQTMLPPARFATQKVTFAVPVKDMLGHEESIFVAKGEKLIYAGWMSAFKDNVGKDSSFPAVSNGSAAKVEGVNLKASKTKPPVRYTEFTYPKAMANIGKNVVDPKLRKLLVNSDGIGTPATRKTIVETLSVRGYIEVKKETFYSTQKGRDVIKNVPKWLSSPETTALWEDYLVKICNQQDDQMAIKMRDEFVSKQIARLEHLIGEMNSRFKGDLGERIQGGGTVTKNMKAAIQSIAKNKGINLDPETLKDASKAKAFLDEHVDKEKMDPNAPPTEGQVKWATDILNNLDEDLRKKVKDDPTASRKNCREFIDKFKQYSPPTPGQKSFAEKLAGEMQEGETPPENYLKYSGVCSKFIDSQKKGKKKAGDASGKRTGKSGTGQRRKTKR